MTREDAPATEPAGVAPEEALRLVLDALVDEAGADSFPASDPPSFWARDPRADAEPAGDRRATPD